eukprot:3172312-Pyramimonas_sp.AAC.1
MGQYGRSVSRPVNYLLIYSLCSLCVFSSLFGSYGCPAETEQCLDGPLETTELVGSSSACVAPSESGDGSTPSCGCSGFSRGEEDDNPISPIPGHATSGSKERVRNDDAQSPPMVRIQGGTFTFGTDFYPYPADKEGPARKVHVRTFDIDQTEVTNEAFARFVQATGFKTEAEKYEWSFVFEPLLSREVSAAIPQAVQGSEWWLPVQGAYWRAPEGWSSDVIIDGRALHPAVHLSWLDARAYCRWESKRLPTEREWEYAAKGNTNWTFPWGDSEEHLHKHANTFQGRFPWEAEMTDGYAGTAPARSFPPNRFGLYNMVGNVWEWTSDLLSRDAGERARIQRGGSYLCHRSHCYRYRATSRSSNTEDSSAGNMGVRCARSVPNGEKS